MAGSVSAQAVYDYVRDRIIRKELFPGNRVLEEELATAMHTSRTTVRRAITRLNYEGLVDLVPNYGAFVAKPTAADMNHVFAVRTILECEAARLAVPRITGEALERMEKNLTEYVTLNRDFHWEILQAADNEYIEKFCHELFNKSAIFLIFYDQTGTNQESIRTHDALLRALRERDTEAAVEASKADIVCAADCLSFL